jgi:ElaB/YqjD/DUF883 family membrane-anchored ribosome-binding protein
MRVINDRAEWRGDDGGAGYGRAERRRNEPRDRGGPDARLRDAHDPFDRPEHVQQLLGDLGALIQGITLATHDVGRVTGRLRGSLSDMAEAVTDAWHVTRRHGGGALKAAGEAIDSRPYVAIGLAAALGVVAGFVVQRGAHSLGQPIDEDDGWDHFV